MQKIAPLVVGAAAVALVAAGCGGGDSGATTNGSGKGTGSGSSDQPLTIGMPNGPVSNNSNPFLNTSAGSALGYNHAIYEPLMEVNETRPTQAPVPWLAKSIAWNKDYTQAKITARDGVKFSDGTPMTAADIAYSIKLRMDNPALNTEGLPYKDVTQSGDVVSVTFTRPQFVNEMKVAELFVVPKHIWEKIKDPTKDLNQHPVGTGPYVLKSFAGQTITLDRNDDYWGGKLAVPELLYTAYKSNDSLTTALQTGEAQWGWTFIADYKDVYLARDPAHYTVFFPAGLTIDQLVLNTANAPFDDVAVRKALNMVIDRQKSSTIAESGTRPALTNVTAIPTPAGSSFISDKYKDTNFSVDVAGAKKLLTDAGYTYSGDKLMGKDGKQVSFTLQDPSGWNDYVTNMQLIAVAAKSIGIAASVKTPNQDAWASNMNTGDFDASEHWTNIGSTPYELYSNMFDPNYYEPLGKPATWDLGRYNDPTAKKLFTTYVNATDDATRKAALDRLQDLYVADVPAIGLDASSAVGEMSTKYWTGWPDDADPYANPQPSAGNVALILTKLKPAS
jgi:peptide/nickel transport system substrate-binding protein